MNINKLSFIGGGNMARSLIGGLITNGFAPKQIYVADPSADSRQSLAATFSVHTHDDNTVVVQDCDVLVLAVKPQQLQAVVKQLAPHLPKNVLLISIAAGIKSADIARWAAAEDHADIAIIRVMPNTPSLVQAGASGLYANDHVTTAQHQQAESLLNAVGITAWVTDETQLDAVTALSGSGPAYFFLLMEAMENAAIELGLSTDTARQLCLQTAFGAAKMALDSPDSAATLRKKVTSPGGTTEQAILSFESADFHGLVQRALTAAADRADSLATELGQDNA